MPRKSPLTEPIRLRLSFTPELYRQIKKFQSENILPNEQSVINMALARFFTNTGELLHNNKNKKEK